MTDEIVEHFFAWAPLVLFVSVLIAVYLAKRNEGEAPAAYGKSFACAQCGRRGKHEHMVPVTLKGAVLWYCPRCAPR